MRAIEFFPSNSTATMADYGSFFENYGRLQYYKRCLQQYFISPPGDNGTLVQNADGSYTYITPGGVTFNFNAAGQETSQISTCGCTQYTFTYNVAGNLATMTGTDGAFSTFNDGQNVCVHPAGGQEIEGRPVRLFRVGRDAETTQIRIGIQSKNTEVIDQVRDYAMFLVKEKKIEL